MKLQVTKENLHRALSAVARVAQARSTLPILANVLIKTDKNRLSIVATNLDIAITQYVGAKITEPGSITVPARLMHDFVASLPSSTVSLELNGHHLNISTEHYQSTINGIVADEFPSMPAITKGISWSVEAQAFRQALSQVIIAASNDESRPVLSGIYMFTEESALHLVATDSYRLAQKNVGRATEQVKLLLPASSLQDLLRVISDDTTEISITHNNQQVLFLLDDSEIVTRLIDGKFPDYQQLLPKTFTTKARLKRTELLNITKVSSLFARENAGSVTLNVSESEGSVSIHSIASQLGENTSSTPAEISGGGEITLNSRYLLDALQVFSGEEINLCFNGKLDPCVLSDPKDSNYLHLIMPLKS